MPTSLPSRSTGTRLMFLRTSGAPRRAPGHLSVTVTGAADMTDFTLRLCSRIPSTNAGAR